MPQIKKSPSKNEKVISKKAAKGDTYMRGECGLTVIIDEPCGCEDECDIICCGEPMEMKRKTKTAK